MYLCRVCYNQLMIYSQKYTLVGFLEPVEVGFAFDMSNWPVHITLADVFAINLTESFEKSLADLSSEQSSLILDVGEDAVLGAAGVNLLNTSDELQHFHNTIVDLLEVYGATFNTPQFTRYGFLPHISVQKTKRTNEGDRIKINFASLVDMFPGGDWQQRKVLKNFSLKKK